ncbi:MAG TPA: glycosyltransferase [Rhodocyclaceae bacterium]
MTLLHQLPWRSEVEIMGAWPPGDPPLVSVCCATYNHAAYIEEALCSFLQQQTCFPFEIIVRDDASTDGTAAKVADFAQRYPNIIRPLLNAENRFSKGERALQVWPGLVRGKYLALCEGDDFWLSAEKLQKQADALERQPAAGICFHGSATLEDGVLKDSVFRYEPRLYRLDEHVLADFHFMQTNTLMFRREFLDPAFIEFLSHVTVGDFFLRFYAGRGGAICLPEQMGCYRVFSAGSWSSRLREEDNRRAFFARYLDELRRFDAFLGHEHADLLARYRLKVLIALARSPVSLRHRLKIILRHRECLTPARMFSLAAGWIRSGECLRKLKCRFGRLLGRS